MRISSPKSRGFFWDFPGLGSLTFEIFRGIGISHEKATSDYIFEKTTAGAGYKVQALLTIVPYRGPLSEKNRDFYPLYLIEGPFPEIREIHQKYTKKIKKRQIPVNSS